MAVLAALFLASALAGCKFEDSNNIPQKIQEKDNLKVYSATTQPNHNIELSKEVNYRDTSEVMFSSMIKGVEVDDDGNVYIFDFRQKKVHVFTNDGNYRQSIGREGRGPGEFISPWQIRVSENKLYVMGVSGPDGHLYLALGKNPFSDSDNHLRIHEFDEEGALVRRYKAISEEANLTAIFDIDPEDGRLFVVTQDAEIREYDMPER